MLILHAVQRFDIYKESLKMQPNTPITTSRDNTDKLAADYTRIHIDKARDIAMLANTFNAGGEDGVLLWLHRQDADSPVYAYDICEHFGLTPGRVANIIKKL